MGLIDEETDRYTIKVDPNKRTGKTKDLEENIIDVSLYSESAKTCGFTTKDPLIWIQAFERYYEQQTKLKCEWNKVSNQNQQYSELQLFVHNQTGSKCITIHIYLTTGVILIKGSLWKQWAENEFAIFKAVIDNFDKDENGDTAMPHPLQWILCHLFIA